MTFSGLDTYGTIVLDPPWQYHTSKVTRRTGRKDVSAEEHYSTMTNAEIAALPVGDLADKNAHLYLWVTNPRLYAGRSEQIGPDDMLTGWGFRYITLITWVKQGTLGMGFYFRGETEHALFATRGKAPIPVEKRQRNVFTAAKRGHSQKPTAFFDLVEAVSPGPYVELFARQQRLGWDSWGYGDESHQPTTKGQHT